MKESINNKNNINLPDDLIELKKYWIEDGEDFEGKNIEGRFYKIYVSRKEFDLVYKKHN